MLEKETEEEESAMALVGGALVKKNDNSELEAERKKLEEAHNVAMESNSALKGAVDVSFAYFFYNFS